MTSDGKDAERKRKLHGAVKALGRAIDDGHPEQIIYQLKVAEWLLMSDDVRAPPPPPPPALGTLLDITRVMALTGYSKSRLRHMGHRLAGYWKSPTGKVGWWSGPLLAALGILSDAL
jgi:hypothetical protein